MQLIKLTNQEETPLSYRKARVINNHLAQLNTVLASTLRATLKSLKSSDLLTAEHTKKTKLSNRRGINSSLN